MELSPARKEILSIVRENSKPVCVRDIKAAMSDRAVNLSTVYRALDYLEKKEMVRSIPLGGARYYYSSREKGHGHFLVCRECREIINFEECAVGELQEKLQEKYGYEITGHALFFEGLCADCRNWKRKRELKENL